MLNNELNEEIIPIIPTRECRICYEEVTEKIEFCTCRGTMADIHLDCLLRWLEIDKDNKNGYSKMIKKCEICNSEVEVIIYRQAKYYLFIILLMSIYFSIVYIIIKEINIHNSSLSDGYFSLFLFFVIGIIYYSVIIILSKKIFKSLISFRLIT